MLNAVVTVEIGQLRGDLAVGALDAIEGTFGAQCVQSLVVATLDVQSGMSEDDQTSRRMDRRDNIIHRRVRHFLFNLQKLLP